MKISLRFAYCRNPLFRCHLEVQWDQVESIYVSCCYSLTPLPLFKSSLSRCSLWIVFAFEKYLYLVTWQQQRKWRVEQWRNDGRYVRGRDEKLEEKDLGAPLQNHTPSSQLVIATVTKLLGAFPRKILSSRRSRRLPVSRRRERWDW